MKKLSIWAQRHPWLARTSLFVAHVYLFGLAISMGIWLCAKTIIIPHLWIALSGGGFLLALFFYPIRRSKHLLFRHTFWRQKLLDLVLVSTSMMMVSGISNHWTRADQQMVVNTYEVQTIVYKIPPKRLRKEKRRARKSARKQLLQEVRATVKQLRQQQTSPGQIALIILTILAGLYAIIFITALSCSISCSGNQGGATLLLFAGLGLVLFLAILAIRAIIKMNPHPSTG